MTDHLPERAPLRRARRPIFWFPYLYQSLNKEQGFTITPGYSSVWGTYLLGQYTFPLAENMSGKLRVDLMRTADSGSALMPAGRKPAGRLGDRAPARARPRPSPSADKREQKQGKGWGRFRSYIIDDSNPEKNKTSLAREQIDSTRYRVSLQDRTYWTEDIYTSIDINKLSDRRFLQDFAPGEFRQNPNPDNAISHHEMGRGRHAYPAPPASRSTRNSTAPSGCPRPPSTSNASRFFGNSGVFYDGETSAGYLRRNFAIDSSSPTTRLSGPIPSTSSPIPAPTAAGSRWCPKVGVRGTYYQDSGYTEHVAITDDDEDECHRSHDRAAEVDPATGQPSDQEVTTTRTEEQLRLGRLGFPAGGQCRARSVVQIFPGLRERAVPDVGSRWPAPRGAALHECFVHLHRRRSRSRSSSSTGSTARRNCRRSTSRSLTPSTRIDNWSIVRLGMRNRLQTRRDNLTFSWLELDTFFDVNIDRPDFGSLPAALGHGHVLQPLQPPAVESAPLGRSSSSIRKCRSSMTDSPRSTPRRISS